MSHNPHATGELLKVGLIGFLGSFASIKLTDVAVAGSIAVSLVTFLYVTLKLVILWRNRNKFPLDLE